MSISLVSHLDAGDAAAALRADALAGLTATPKSLPPRWFYDERGSELFDRITRLPEYYPTRTERAILVDRAPEIAAVTGADVLVELGSGTSEKTRLLLSALRDAGTLRRFVPVDVDPSVLRAAGAALDPAARLNLLATDGIRLLATTWGDTLSILTTTEGTALASEPYDDDGRWRDVPDRHLVEAGPDGIVLTALEEPA